MRTALFAAASLVGLSILGAAPASAETQPRSIGADPRIKQYTYSKDTVYRLDLALKFITSIEFARGEAIDSVLMGDRESWQVIRLQSGNVLAVKPLIAGARTNMTVYTSQNTYTFELRAVPIPAGSSTLNYRIGFRYPERERARAVSRQADQMRPRDPNYYVAGPKTDFRPVAVHDDGRRTTFEFPPDAPRPAIFRVDEQGRESIINVRETETGAVVMGTSDRWTLRIGEEELCVAHERVIKTVPGGRRAKALRAGYLAATAAPASAIPGLPK
jgi:type IV secretion system protein VirB9